MARRTHQLLLVESVENLGIVGDIVRVKAGYARNYLLPMGLAEVPTDEKIEALKEERAKALAAQSALRSAREEAIEKLRSIEIKLVRSCNDQGALYGSVTQRDIADGLMDLGYDISLRAIRLSQPIRRIGDYPVPIQFEKDLRTEITVIVEPDQPLEEREEMEFDDEGNLIEKPVRAPRPRAAEAAGDGAEGTEKEASAAS